MTRHAAVIHERPRAAGCPASFARWQRRAGAVVLIAVMLAFAGLIVRLVWIQTALGDRLTRAASAQQLGRRVIPARRGTMFDARGRVVASSRRRPDVFVDPALVDEVDPLAEALSLRVGMPADRIRELIEQRRKSRFVVVAPRVDEETAESVRAMRHPAVGLDGREVRTYPLGDSMGHVLGFVGRDGGGLEGLELSFDAHLAGAAGRRACLRDARRRALWPSDERTVAPIDGGHIVLTLDAEIQRIAEEQLERAVTRFEAESGVAIVMSPTSGAILAMACWPGFDPAEAASLPAERRRNRAVTDPTEPGSTFKPFIISGALAGGHVSTSDRFDCHMGAMHFGRRLIRDTSPHGVMDLKEIVTKSSNIGMGLIGQRMGNEVLHETLRRFGFGSRTGIDLPGESAGLVYALRRWTSYSTTSIPMGYEVGITPLQLITALCALVNDGVLLKPRLIKSLLDSRGRTIRSFEAPQIVRRVVPTEIARYVSRDVMVAVMEEGTGRRANTGPYRLLGKTGTAKLPFRDRRGYEPGAYVGTFMGAAPVRDPQVAAMVMIRRPNPKLGYYGGTVAGPAVGEILTATLAYLGVSAVERVASSGL